jgi:hypothetical protein
VGDGAQVQVLHFKVRLPRVLTAGARLLTGFVLCFSSLSGCDTQGVLDFGAGYQAQFASKTQVAVLFLSLMVCPVLCLIPVPGVFVVVCDECVVPDFADVLEGLIVVAAGSVVASRSSDVLFVLLNVVGMLSASGCLKVDLGPLWSVA